MNLTSLTKKIGADILTGAANADTEIEHVYAGDRISDMLAQSTPRTLVVTNLTGAQLLRVAELMDIPAICLVGGVQPDPDMRAAAEGRGLVVLISPVDMFETCGRIYQALGRLGA